jgi:phosphoglycerate dehydrogenase-like enzyme
MTLALVTARLSDEARGALGDEFGWSLVTIDATATGLPPVSVEGLDLGLVEAIVIETEPVNEQTLVAFPALRLIACLRSSPVNVDLAAATRRAIPVLAAPGRNTEAVADFVLGLMLAAVRHIAHTHHLIVTRELTEDRVEEERTRTDVIWRPSDPSRPIPYHRYKGPELRTLTLGLLGFGRIGRRVAEKARALEMRVLAHDPHVAVEEMALGGVAPVSLGQLLAESDVLSLHARSRTPLLGERELALMKPGAYVVNTARAALVDYEALVRALRDGRLAGAALDVFPDEPLSTRSPLLDLPNVTLTPHLGGASTNIVEHQSRILLEGLRALLAGHEAPVENPEVLERWAIQHVPAATARRG